VDKRRLVQLLRECANLQAIEGVSDFKVRSLQQVSEMIAKSPLSVAEIMRNPEALPDIKSATADLISTIVNEGSDAAFTSLHLSIPTSVADLTRLPGIGPKTARRLYINHHIAAIEDLDAAAQDGRLTAFSGLGARMIPRLKRDIAVLIAAKHNLSIATACPLATTLQQKLAAVPGVLDVAVAGDLRRLETLCPRLEFIVQVSDVHTFLDWAEQFPTTAAQTDRANYNYIEISLGELICFENPDGVGDVTLPQQQIPVRIHISTNESQFAAQLMYTTGDDVHQELMAAFASQQGCAWTPYGITNEDGEVQPLGTETAIYNLFSLPYFPAEVRDLHGLRCQPERLIRRADIRGDLHVHSQWSDASLSIRDIAEEASRLGYEYIAITDHSQSLTIAHGLSPARLSQQREEINRIQRETKVTILHGIEVDILADGRLDLPEECLQQLDIVVASVHSSMGQSERQMTDRIVRAMQSPSVNILGHLTGRILGRRFGYEVDFPRILAAATAYGVILELNANPNRLDISDNLLRQAKSAGIQIAINTDAHHLPEFENMGYGIRMGLRGLLEKTDVLNTLPLSQLQAVLRKRRQ